MRDFLKLLASVLVAYCATCLGDSSTCRGDLQEFFAAQEAKGARFLDPQKDPPIGRVVKYDGNPILLAPPPTPEICHPQVWNESGTLSLFYVNYHDLNPAPPACLGLATSNDGLNWEHYSGNPILSPSVDGWDCWRVGYHSLVKVGSTYYLYYTGGAGGTSWQGIGLATSTDLLHWEKHSANPLLRYLGSGFEKTGICVPCVFIDSGTWYMYYTGLDGAVGNIGLATSSDGLNWQRYGINPVMERSVNSWDSLQIIPQEIIKYDNRYYMFYNGWNGDIYSAGIAVSQNLINWTKYKGNPTITVNRPVSWENRIVDHQFVMPLDGKYWVWYSAENTSYIQSIGLGFLAATRTGLNENWENLGVGDSPVKNGWIESWSGPTAVEAGAINGGSKILRLDANASTSYGEGFQREDLLIVPGADGKAFFEYDFSFTYTSGTFEFESRAGQSIDDEGALAVQNLRKINGVFTLRNYSISNGWQTIAYVKPGEMTHVFAAMDTNTEMVDYVVDSPTYGEQTASLRMREYERPWVPGGAFTGVLFHNWHSSTSSVVVDNIRLYSELEPLPGDADQNGAVDGDDAAILAANWMSGPGATWWQGDFNDDGWVNDIDATLMAANWLKTSFAAVPESGMIFMLASVAALLGNHIVGKK